MAEKKENESKVIKTPQKRTVFSQQITPKDQPYDVKQYIVPIKRPRKDDKQ